MKSKIFSRAVIILGSMLADLLLLSACGSMENEQKQKRRM